MSVEPRGLWTENDFDLMGWHDSRVHAISLDPDSSEVPGSVALDLDYIVEWVEPTTPGGTFSFWVAPATLVFPGSSDLVLGVALGGLMELEIDSIARTSGEGWRGGPDACRWTITGSLNLEVTAVGFLQYIRKAPRLVQRQALSLAERGGVSFAMTSYR